MIELDTQRRINGTYKNYEMEFVLKKQRDYILDMLEQLRDGYSKLDDKDVMEFVNEFGDRESWSGLDVNKLKQEMQKDIKEGVDSLERVEKSLSELQMKNEQARS